MLKCTESNFGWGFAPNPAAGAKSAPRDPLDGFKGPTSKERREEGRREESKGGKEWDGTGERRGREERGLLWSPKKSLK